MSALAALKAAISLTDVAVLIGFKPAALSYILYKKGIANSYVKFEIPKRCGGARPISAPTVELKLMQRRLADVLQDCADEINKVNGFADGIAHGFKKQRSIITNARQHRRRRFVFNVDLHNFFGTINFGRVRGFFIKDKHFLLKENVATVLAQIICFENALPQGGPCSPTVSNLIAHILDMRLVRLAARSGCRYTRYADDLTFSTNAGRFPEGIGKPIDAGAHLYVAGSKLQRIIEKCGFQLNPSKTRMQYCRSRQDVTGLTVNSRLNTRREYRHVVRAMVHRLVNAGSFEIVQRVPDGAGGMVVQNVPGTTQQLRGMLGFIDCVDLYNGRLLSETISEKCKNSAKLCARQLVYRRFLLFTELYAASRPLLIGEGSTDYVYLLHAIRGLASSYPLLAAIDGSGKITLKTKIYKYSGSSTDRLLGIHGGSANLNKLIYLYENERKHFAAPGAIQPVILVIDNDSGADAIFSVIQQLTKQKGDRTKAFIHVIGNLYVVPTPLGSDGTASKMEDFFSNALKATLVNGKAFDDSNNTESASHYGKTIFAHKVVKPQADTIDFSGFTPILDRIVAVLDEHAKKVAAQAVVGSVA
jgi:RNA-directed DNA polymerase